MLRKKIIKRCAQGHEMELTWKRCPRCTGRRPLQVEARDVVDQTMIAGPEVAPADATRIVNPSVVRSRAPSIAAPVAAPRPPAPPPSAPAVHPAWAGPPATPAAPPAPPPPAHPSWAGPPATPSEPPAPAHPSWAGPPATPAAPPAPAHPSWAGPPATPPARPEAPAPAVAPPSASPTATPASPGGPSPPRTVEPPAAAFFSASPAAEPGSDSFFSADPEVDSSLSSRRAAESGAAHSDPVASPATPELSRDLSVRSRAKLECIGGPLKGRMFMLAPGAYRLGKAPRDLPDSKSIVIAGDRFVSKDHAVILVEPSGIVLTDPGSTNGCFVNGEKVTRSELQNGDEVRLGESVFRFSKLGS